MTTVAEAEPRPRARRWAWIVAFLWFASCCYLLLSTALPDAYLRSDSFGHLLLFGAVGLSNLAVAISYAKNALEDSRMVWLAAAATSALALAFELLQMLVPSRAFEVDDLVWGVVGAFIAAAATMFFVTLAPRRAAITALVVVSLVALVAVWVVALQRGFDRPTDVQEPDAFGCSERLPPLTPNGDVRIRLTVDADTDADGCVPMPGGWLVPFGMAPTPIDTNDGMTFRGGGLRSGLLPELAEAIKASDELTIAVRFRSEHPDEPPASRFIVELFNDDPWRLIARTYHSNGARAISNLGVGEEPAALTTLAAPLVAEPGVWHEVVATADGRDHRLYVNGVEVGSAATTEPIADRISDAIRITVGGRDTGRNQFLGQISDIIVLPDAIRADEVDTLF